MMRRLLLTTSLLVGPVYKLQATRMLQTLRALHKVKTTRTVLSVGPLVHDRVYFLFGVHVQIAPLVIHPEQKRQA